MVNGKQRRGNPIGRDDQPLKCHGRGSDSHLHAAFCSHQRRSTSTHSVVADYEFVLEPNAQAITDERATVMQRVADRDMGDNAANHLGIVTYLGTIDPSQDDAATTTEAADPLQQRDPWGDSRLPRPSVFLLF